MADRGGWFARFLAADTRDIGCDETRAVLHVYVDTVMAAVDAPAHYPGVSAHLAACDSCAEDMRGLLAAVHDDDLRT